MNWPDEVLIKLRESVLYPIGVDRIEKATPSPIYSSTPGAVCSRCRFDRNALILKLLITLPRVLHGLASCSNTALARGMCVCEWL